MPEPVIVAAVRTPIGRAFKGSLVGVRPDDLTADIVRAALARVPEVDPHEVEDLIVGCGLPGGEQGFNIARIVAVLAGLRNVPGTTVTRYCASSLQAIRMAAHAIKAGEGDVFVAAGVEMVTRLEKGHSDSLPDTQNPLFTTHHSETDGIGWTASTGLPNVYIPMGETAENVAAIECVSREEMDEFALLSQQRAVAAQDRGFYEREIVPVALPSGEVLSTDDGPRRDTTLEKLASLKPIFRPDGRVTAGNSCPLNDGAAAVVVMSDERARALQVRPLARVVSTAVSGIDPEIMGLGPIEASRRALSRAGMTIDDVDLVEINEAFAAQVIPSARAIGVEWDKLNVNGGAIALGHPFGMTGARIMATLLNSLADSDGTVGLETMCIGGGQGMAIVIERFS